jgi:hypothetical protein
VRRREAKGGEKLEGFTVIALNKPKIILSNEPIAFITGFTSSDDGEEGAAIGAKSTPIVEMRLLGNV